MLLLIVLPRHRDRGAPGGGGACWHTRAQGMLAPTPKAAGIPDTSPRCITPQLIASITQLTCGDWEAGGISSADPGKFFFFSFRNIKADTSSKRKKKKIRQLSIKIHPSSLPVHGVRDRASLLKRVARSMEPVMPQHRYRGVSHKAKVPLNTAQTGSIGAINTRRRCGGGH